MGVNLNGLKQYNMNKNLYTYHSAKKIYFACTPSKFILLEKNESKPSVMPLSLISRNAVVINRKNGMLIYPKNK